MTVFFRIGILLMVLALPCWAMFALIGSHVDGDGVLREPFFLLGGGWLLMLAGVGITVVALVLRVLRRF